MGCAGYCGKPHLSPPLRNREWMSSSSLRDVGATVSRYSVQSMARACLAWPRGSVPAGRIFAGISSLRPDRISAHERSCRSLSANHGRTKRIKISGQRRSAAMGSRMRNFDWVEFCFGHRVPFRAAPLINIRKWETCCDKKIIPFETVGAEFVSAPHFSGCRAPCCDFLALRCQ